MNKGVLTGTRRLPHLATENIYTGAPSRELIEPEHVDDSAILIKSPSENWGLNSPYGYGQAIALYQSSDRYASNPVTDDVQHRRVIFRVDSIGGMGLAGGMHVATGRNIPQAGITEHVWIDGSYMDIVGTVLTQFPSATKDVVDYVNSAGQTLTSIDPSQNWIIASPDSSPRGLKVGDVSGTGVANIYAGAGNFGTRILLAESTAGNILLYQKLAASGTGDFTQYANSAGTVLLRVVSTGQLKTSSGNEATGAGSAALGANSPAVTNTAPYKWLKFTTSDGSQVYVPAWK